MNKNRLPAYLKLIEVLLECPSGEEAEILFANRDLMDADLLQVMTQVAKDLEQRGYNNNAAFLTDLATQLAQALKLSPSNSRSKTQLGFD